MSNRSVIRSQTGSLLIRPSGDILSSKDGALQNVENNVDDVTSLINRCMVNACRDDYCKKLKPE